MAISGGDGSIILTTKVDETGLKKGLGPMKKLGATAGKAFLAIGAATVAATVAITKMAVSAYADYEQLVGGVETLFGKSSKKMLEYANQAYKTAGLSANAYMETATSFSASLLSSLGGDTEKAADYANRAIIDMSDNANKMGTSMEMIQNAYQGFAKQNYTMLDNLKLGYGGTKTEMERLVKDASQLKDVQSELGVTVDANSTSFGNVVNAISVMQKQMGIAGTTADEAERTISGSWNMLKSSWQNLLTAVSGGGNLDSAIQNLVYSLEKYLNNIIPVVERMLIGIGYAIERIAPILVERIANALVKAIPSLLAAVYQMIIGIGKGIYQGIVSLIKGETTEAFATQSETIANSVENQEALTDAVEETNDAVKKGLASFDEINQVAEETASSQEESANSSQDIVVGGSGGDILSTVGEINSTLALIMGVVGGAMIAIGLLLLFTGNIAWGIGFIIFGGITVGATIGVVSGTNIDTETSEKIGSITKIIGGSMVAIGLLLLFLGQIPWGLGFIAAGAGLVSVSEMFPTTTSEDVKSNCDAILSFLAGLVAYLVAHALLKNWATFVALWKDFRALMSLIHSEGFFKTITGLFGSSLSTMQLWAIAIGIVVGSIAYLALNWDKLSPAQRVIAILSALATAATVAAVAIALFHTTWSVGIAAAAIAGGIALLAGTYLFKNANAKTSLSGGGTAPTDISQYAYLAEGGTYNLPHLAQGAVIPPNREFLAVLGDQKQGRNLEAPESLLREIYAEGNAETNALLQQLIQVMQRGMTVNVDGQQLMRINRDAETRSGRQTVTGGFANAY